MKNYVGLSCGFHDSAVSVIDSSGNILFASHSERYSKIKHDLALCNDILIDAKNYLNSDFQLHYYERPFLKYLRQLIAGQDPELSNINVKNIIGQNHLSVLNSKKVHTHNHHLSHAAAGFQTSPFNDAIVVIIDAIGEFDTISIWHAEYKNGDAIYKNLWSHKYPHSIGLFYSAMTDRLGLRPLDEEYILMGMAGWGTPTCYEDLKSFSIDDKDKLIFKNNFHMGIDHSLFQDKNDYDIASSTQKLTEELIEVVMKKARSYEKSDNLVYMGGVALNCLANRNLGKFFNNIWIMPNPGDAGSSLGAAALGYKKKINWKDAYLGHDILGPYPVKPLAEHLITHKIAGVASGRAEFGPRALGNRSLLADPRGQEIKDRVNEIKRRQKFRPFAPVILEEHAEKYFEMPRGWADSRYMQIVAKCNFPEQFPAIIHVDGTSRVQTVPKDNSGIRQLLDYWYAKTGCPLLLNTSLNIRGEPMVNDRKDADRFENLYNVKVFS
jgi:carbamoyltransferase